VEEFLSQRGVKFDARDIASEDSALAELEALGVLTTPVTVIDGEMVIGFDRQKLDQLLRDAGHPEAT
jgi:hypothetical protein